MKKFLLLIILLAAQSVSAKMFTQSATVSWDGTYRTTFTINFPQPTNLPSTLILIAWGDQWPTITDDAGDIWETATDAAGHIVRGFWYAQCRSAVNVVTVTFPQPSRFYAVLGEKSGYLDVDVVSQTVDGNSNPSTSATITTSSADFIVGYGWNYTTVSPTLTAGAGYTMEGQAGVFLEDLQQTAPGPISSSVTYGNGWSGWWVQGVVAFKPAIPSFCVCR